MMRTGVDPTLVLSLSTENKATLTALLAPFIKQSLQDAVVYVVHHHLQTVTRKIMIKIMKYHILHPLGVAHMIRPDVENFLTFLGERMDNESDDDEINLNCIPEEEEEVIPFSLTGRESIETHYNDIIDAMTQNDGPQNASSLLMESVIHHMDIDENEDSEVESTVEKASNDEEGKNENEECVQEEEISRVEISGESESEEEEECCCAFCTAVEETEKQWENYQPTEPWQQLFTIHFSTHSSDFHSPIHKIGTAADFCFTGSQR